MSLRADIEDALAYFGPVDVEAVDAVLRVVGEHLTSDEAVMAARARLRAIGVACWAGDVDHALAAAWGALTEGDKT